MVADDFEFLLGYDPSQPWLQYVERTQAMAVAGGHIGYGVLPEHRRKGYAGEILRQSLVIARSHGIDEVLLTCDEHNEASAHVIERCGGESDGIVDNPRGGPRRRRYWFR